MRNLNSSFKALDKWAGGGGLKAVTKMEFFKGKCWTLASLWEYRKETGGKILRGEERLSKVCIIYPLRYGFVSNPCRARSGSTGRSQPGCSRRSSSTSILEAEHKEQAAGFAAEMTDRKKTDQYSKAKGKASKHRRQSENVRTGCIIKKDSLQISVRAASVRGHLFSG